MRPARIFLLVLAAWGIDIPAQAQTTIQVPLDYPTVQAAIAAASNGDTVLVAPGTYLENLNFLGKAILVQSEAGPAVTVLDGGGFGRVVTFPSSEAGQSVLSGFTIRGGSSTAGADVLIQGGAHPILTGNVVEQNTAFCSGAGIAVVESSPSIVGNVIRNNFGCPGGSGGGISITSPGSSATQVLANVIADNTCGIGGGIVFSGSIAPLIRDNRITGNSAASGGAIAWSGSAPRIVQNLIAGNSASSNGGGIRFDGSTPGWETFVVDNTIAGNDAPSGSAVHYNSSNIPFVTLRNNVFAGPPGASVVHLTTYQQNFVTLANNDVLGPPPALLYSGAIPDLTGVAGNLSVDPLFVDSAGGDFHLAPGSPCIDAGFDAVPFLPSLDPDGGDRIVDGDGDGTATVDIGWDEFSPIVPFGEGCPGPGAVTPTIAAAGGAPSVGNGAFAVALSDAAGNAFATLFVGLSSTGWLGFAPPLDLSPLGLPGCSLYVAADIPLATFTTGAGAGTGAATIPLPIPADPALQGGRLYFQWYVSNSPGSAFPGAMTAGLEVLVL